MSFQYIIFYVLSGQRKKFTVTSVRVLYQRAGYDSLISNCIWLVLNSQHSRRVAIHRERYWFQIRFVITLPVRLWESFLNDILHRPFISEEIISNLSSRKRKLDLRLFKLIKRQIPRHAMEVSVIQRINLFTEIVQYPRYTTETEFPYFYPQTLLIYVYFNQPSNELVYLFM